MICMTIEYLSYNALRFLGIDHTLKARIIDTILSSEFEANRQMPQS